MRNDPHRNLTFSALHRCLVFEVLSRILFVFTHFAEGLDDIAQYQQGAYDRDDLGQVDGKFSPELLFRFGLCRSS